LNSRVRVRGVIKIYRVREVQVSHFSKNQELRKFKLAIFSKKQELAKFKLEFFLKSKVSKVRVGLMPKMLKLELELMDHDTFSSASLLTTFDCYQSNT
jgi:hypothetical protein